MAVPSSLLLATLAGCGGGSPKEEVVFPPSNTRYSTIPSLSDAPWADELQDEQDQCEQRLSETMESFLTGSCEGKYVNVSSGGRMTRRSTVDAARHVSIWFSGGSAAFGIAQRDSGTVASQLVKLAEEDGIALDIQNLAHVGFDLHQEIEYEIRPKLQQGPPPDIIVVFDGFNDAAGEVFTDFLEGIDPNRDHAPLSSIDVNEINERADTFLHAPREELDDLGNASGRIAAKRYRALQDDLRALAPAETQIEYFFQPDALVSVTQIEDAYGQVIASPSAIASSPLAIALDRMSSELEDEVVNLRPLFEDEDRPAFVGLVHQNEWGAAQAANAIYTELLPTLREMTR